MKYLIDLDGTLMDGKVAYAGAVDFIGALREAAIEFFIMTNSIKSPGAVKDRLAAVGMAVSEDQVLNPIRAVNMHMRKNGVTRVYVAGGAPEIAQVQARHDEADPELIALLDFEKNDARYGDLQRIFTLLQRGVPVVAASGSIFYNKEGIRFLDTGAFVKLLEAATGKAIPILGKPSAEYFSLAIDALGVKPSEVTVIGDDWSTDIAGAASAGCKSLLVTTGKYQAGDETKCKPAHVITNLMQALP